MSERIRKKAEISSDLDQRDFKITDLFLKEKGTKELQLLKPKKDEHLYVYG